MTTPTPNAPPTAPAWGVPAGHEERIECMSETETEARIHDLKTWPAQFAAVIDGRKRFEVRVNDRDYAVGDVLRLREWRPELSFANATGRVFDVRVTYMAQGVFGLPAHLCVLSVEPIASEPRFDALRALANNLPDSFIAEIRVRGDLATALAELTALRNWIWHHAR
jgi:hypothetical protein